jgi:hypothetical protein
MGNDLVKWAELYDLRLFLSGPRLYCGEVPCTGPYVDPDVEEAKYIHGLSSSQQDGHTSDASSTRALSKVL